MATYLIVIEGPKKGERIELKGGERVGREKSDIVLSDPKVSGFHAVIKKSLMGAFSIVDQKSKNGIISEGSRVDKVKLLDGVEFRIGSSLFRVEVLKEGTQTNFVSGPASDEIGTIVKESVGADGAEMVSAIRSVQPPAIDNPIESPPGEPVHEETFAFEQKTPLDLEKDDLSGLSMDQLTSENPAQKNLRPTISFRTVEAPKASPEPGREEEDERKTWSQVLENYSRDNIRNSEDRPLEVEPFSPRVKLTVFRGIQAETEWELGYGPRSAGRTSLDLPLFESQAPPNKCFEILPSPDGPLFFTKHPREVQINGQAVEKVALKSGDIITIFETQIEVEFF